MENETNKPQETAEQKFKREFEDSLYGEKARMRKLVLEDIDKRSAELESEFEPRPFPGASINLIEKGEHQNRGWNASYAPVGCAVVRNRHFLFSRPEDMKMQYFKALEYCEKERVKQKREAALLGEQPLARVKMDRRNFRKNAVAHFVKMTTYLANLPIEELRVALGEDALPDDSERQLMAKALHEEYVRIMDW